MPAEKLNLFKKHKTDYAAGSVPQIIKLKPAVYLTVEGQGEPGGEAFTAAIGALYAMAYTIKMTRKQAGRRDYSVCALEGQWWADAPGGLAEAPREQFRWTLMIRTPEFVHQKDLDDAVAKALQKGKPDLVKQVKLETIDEGQCVQMLHIGPYAKEAESIAAMQAFVAANELAIHGVHHEIYLNDPRRVPESRIKTILRMPVH
jgi:hypothetical protein